MSTSPAVSLETLRNAIRAVADGEDEAAIVRAADRHGLRAILHEAASAAAAAPLARALHDDVVAAIAQESLVAIELRRVLGGLQQAGVEALLAKGAALAYTVYDAAWLRPRVDTDLLVDADGREAAQAALEALGYTRSDALTSGTLVSSQCAYERYGPGGLRHVIDLHWQAVNPRLFAHALPFAEVWRDRRPVTTLGAGWVLGPVDALQLAAVHRLAHHQGGDRLIWLYDIHLITSGFVPDDWDRLTRGAVQRQIAGVCGDALDAAARTFGTAVPGRVRALLQRTGHDEPSARYLRGLVPAREVLLHDLERLPSWRARLTLLREHAFPPVAFMRSRYQVQSSLWLPALYAHRLVTGAYRWIRA